jgi:hypothetical protein
MRKSAIATFITTLSLVAVTLVSACSPDRPDNSGRTAVPSDMPGARNSAASTSSSGSISIAYPLPGTVVTNTVTVQGTGQQSGTEYHVGIGAGGLYLAEDIVSPVSLSSNGAFSVTLYFDAVTTPVDGEVTVYTTTSDSGTVDQQAVVPVKIAPASIQSISGPVIHLSPVNGHAGTPLIVIGSDFPPNTRVEVRLSGVSTEATEQAYIAGTTDANGEFKLSFTMPAFWPNGDPIVAPQVLVVASTPDFVSKATAIFGFSSTAAPETGTPLPGEQLTARIAADFLAAWSNGSASEALDYLSAGYREHLSADGDVKEGIAGSLGIRSLPADTTLAVIASTPDETVVRATFQANGSGRAHRADITFEEAIEGWKIVWIGPAMSEMR